MNKSTSSRPILSLKSKGILISWTFVTPNIENVLSFNGKLQTKYVSVKPGHTVCACVEGLTTIHGWASSSLKQLGLFSYSRSSTVSVFLLFFHKTQWHYESTNFNRWWVIKLKIQKDNKALLKVFRSFRHICEDGKIQH